MNNRESASTWWARIIEAHRANRLSIAEFCGRQSVSQPSFFNWRRRLSAAGRAGAPAFVEVKVGAPEPGGAAAGAKLELIVHGGLRVEVRCGLLRELLAALEPTGGPT